MMQTATKKSMWADIEAALLAGELPTGLAINAAGRLMVPHPATGQGMELPAWLVELCPPGMRAEAQRQQAAREAEAQRAFEARAQADKEERDRRFAEMVEAASGGFYVSFQQTRLCDADGRRVFATPAEAARVADFNFFRETDPDTCAHLGFVLVGALDAAGRPATDANGLELTLNGHLFKARV